MTETNIFDPTLRMVLIRDYAKIQGYRAAGYSWGRIGEMYDRRASVMTKAWERLQVAIKEGKIPDPMSHLIGRPAEFPSLPPSPLPAPASTPRKGAAEIYRERAEAAQAAPRRLTGHDVLADLPPVEDPFAETRRDLGIPTSKKI